MREVESDLLVITATFGRKVEMVDKEKMLKKIFTTTACGWKLEYQ